MGGGGCGDGAKHLELNCGCRITVDFGFPAMLCIVCLWGDRAFLLQCLAVCMLHEAGHGMAMWLTRAGIREIRFGAAGMQMLTQTVCLSRLQRFCISMSGPAANLLAAALLYRMRPETALLHLCMGSFNLLPCRVLDGGSALRCMFEDVPAAGTQLHVLALVTVAAGAFFLWHAGVCNPMLYLMAVYLAASECRPAA